MSVTEQLEYIKGSLNASSDVRQHLEVTPSAPPPPLISRQAYHDALFSKRGEAESEFQRSLSDFGELQKIKSTLESVRFVFLVN